MTDELFPIAAADPELEAVLFHPPEPPRFNRNLEAVGNFLWQAAETMTPDQIRAEARARVEQTLIQEADGVVSDETLTPEQRLAVMEGIALRAGENQKNVLFPELVVAARNDLADQESDPQLREALKIDRADYLAGRKAAREDIVKWRDMRVASLGDNDIGVEQLAQAAEAVFFSPNMVLKAGNIISEFVPDFSTSDYLLPGKGIKKMHEVLLSMPEAERKLALDKIGAMLVDESDLIGKNDYIQAELIRRLFDGIEYDEAHETMNNVVAVLDATAPVIGLPIVKGVQSVFNKVVGLPEIIPWSVADVLGNTTQGATRLLNGLASSTPAATLARAGTTPAAVAGSLIVPKVVANVKALATVKASGIPFLPDVFLSDAERAATVGRYQSVAESYGPRLNDFTWAPIDRGFEYVTTIGNKGGKPFRSISEAKLWSQKAIGEATSYDIVEVGKRRYFVQIKGRKFWDYADVQTDEQIMQDGGLLKQIMNKVTVWAHGGAGKATVLSDRLILASNAAADLSSGEAAYLHRILQPLHSMKLPKQVKVFKTIHENEGVKRLTTAEMIALGHDEAEQAALHAFYRFGDRALQNTNTLVRGQMVSDGWLAGRVAGEQATVRVSQSTAGRAVNMLTGVTAKLEDLKPGSYTAYEFMEESSHGVLRGFVPKGGNAVVSDLPAQVVKAIPGYLTRLYKAPWYIREQMADGTTRAVATAGVKSDAEWHALMLEVQNPGKTFLARQAREIAGDLKLSSELQQMSDQGLLWSSRRSPIVLEDVLGVPKMADVPTRLSAMLNSAAGAVGVKAYSEATSRLLTNTFGRGKWPSSAGYPGFDSALAATPTPAGLGGADIARWWEAKALWQHIRMINGVHPTMIDRQVIQPLQNFLANMVFKGERAAKVPVVGNAVAQASSTLGKNIAGLDKGLGRGLKSATVFSYLTSNIFVQNFLQMSRIPSYMSVRHGAGYTISGQFSKDFAVLMAASHPATIEQGGWLATLSKANEKFALQVATAQGVDRQRAEFLIKAFNNTGALGSVDNHAFIAGTVVDGPLGNNNRVVHGITKVANGLTNLGFKPGVRNDKKAAWLYAFNRWSKDNGGKLPKTEAEFHQIASSMDEISLNMNMTDPLPINSGVLSYFAQFYTDLVKSTARVFQMEGGGQLTRAERVRLSLIPLFFTGAGTFGASQAYDSLEAKVKRKTGMEIPELVSLYAREGIEGFIFNTIMRIGDEEGETTRVDFASKYGPYSHIGNTMAGFSTLLWALTTSGADAIDALPSPASLGLITDVGEAILFAKDIAGSDFEAQPDEQVMAATKNLLMKFPVTSELMRAYMGHNLGVYVNKSGNAVTEITKGEAISTLFGVKPRDVVALQAALEAANGRMQRPDATQENIRTELRNMAKEHSSYIIALLREKGDEVNMLDVRRMLREQAFAMKALTSGEDRAVYIDAVLRAVADSEVMKSEKFINDLRRSALNPSSMGVTANARDMIANLPPFPGQVEFLEELDNMVTAREVGERYILEGK